MPGPPGVDGNTILYGASNPTAGIGVNGNFYINTTANILFGPKAGGAWPVALIWLDRPARKERQGRRAIRERLGRKASKARKVYEVHKAIRALTATPCSMARPIRLRASVSTVILHQHDHAFHIRPKGGRGMVRWHFFNWPQGAIGATGSQGPQGVAGAGSPSIVCRS